METITSANYMHNEFNEFVESRMLNKMYAKQFFVIYIHGTMSFKIQVKNVLSNTSKTMFCQIQVNHVFFQIQVKSCFVKCRRNHVF